MNFKEELAKYQNIINENLENWIKKEKCPEEILNQAMEYSLMAGGKRLRPILTMATYKLFCDNDNIEECIPYAMAIEMVHNFSLIHDDLPGIDNDDFRHGKPTNHKKFNEATAILAGDKLFNEAYMIISNDLIKSKQIDFSKKARVLNEFTKEVNRMIAGEYVDTECEGKKISQEELEYIHDNKTASMLRISVRMGAILGNCTERELQKLTSYAEKIGLAFQIKDDILSVEGDEKILGKPVGNDEKLEKCTYVSQYGLQGAKEILETVTQEAIKKLQEFEEKSEFLKELALYIKNRNK